MWRKFVEKSKSQRRADLEKKETGREEEYIDWTMALDEWSEVVNIYKVMKEGKKPQINNYRASGYAGHSELNFYEY